MLSIYAKLMLKKLTLLKLQSSRETNINLQFIIKNYLKAIIRHTKISNSDHKLKLNTTIQISVLLIILVLSIGTLQINTYASSDLIISEINPSGSVGDCLECSYDKWVEIKNITNQNINLENYKLRFFNSTASEYNLNLDKGLLQPNQTYLIANKRSSLKSILSIVGVTPNQISGKILYISNQENSSVNVALINPAGSIIHNVNLNLNNFESTDTEKRSLEYVDGIFVNSTKVLYGNNFGTPKSSILLPIQQIEEPKPQVATNNNILPNPSLNPISSAPVPITNSSPIPEINKNTVTNIDLNKTLLAKYVNIETNKSWANYIPQNPIQNNLVDNSSQIFNPNLVNINTSIPTPNFNFKVNTQLGGENILKPNYSEELLKINKEVKIYHTDFSIYLSLILIVSKALTNAKNKISIKSVFLDKKFRF
jgi:hypothetical protein